MPDSIMSTEAQQPRNRSAEIKDLAAALCKAQAAMEGAKKDANNPHFNSKYADLASVWDAVRKPLTDNDLCIVQFPRTAGNGVEIETTLMHGKTGQFMSDVLWVPCSKNDAQGLGSAITYGRRYSLMAVTGIAPEDDDGNAAAASHKAGASGSAGGGGDFRPPGPRRFTKTDPQFGYGEGGKAGAIEEARRDGILTNPNDTRSRYEQGKDKKAPNQIDTPAAAASAVKRIEWVKKAAAFLKDAGTDEHMARDWWHQEKERITVVETALPTEYERLLDAYNEALERKVPA